MSEEISDGYHTFGELYEHRHFLFIALMASHPELSWCSMSHSDGTKCYDGYFIAGINPGIYGGRQISYHLPVRLWDIVNSVCNGEQPEYDGHASQDVVDTLGLWALELSKIGNKGKMFRVWEFEDAPEELRRLSSNGGDEDWIVEIPPSAQLSSYGLPQWIERTDACCEPQLWDHPTRQGWKVAIGSHA